MSVQYSLVLVRTECRENKILYMTTDLAMDSIAKTTFFYWVYSVNCTFVVYVQHLIFTSHFLTFWSYYRVLPLSLPLILSPTTKEMSHCKHIRNLPTSNKLFDSSPNRTNDLERRAN